MFYEEGKLEGKLLNYYEFYIRRNSTSGLNFEILFPDLYRTKVEEKVSG